MQSEEPDSVEVEIDTSTLVTIETVIHQEEDGEENVDQSIAKKESEILSMIILHNQESEEAANNVTGEHIVDEQALIVNAEIEATQHMIKNEHSDIEMIEGENLVTMEFHAADAAWITLLDSFEFIINDCRIRGYVEGEKKFLCLWESFQTSTMTTFSVRSSDRFYKRATDGEEGAVNGRILKGAPKWSRTPLVPFDGVPFVSIDRKYFGCRLGGSERKNRKKGLYKTKRTGHSVKVGCPAEADVLEVWRVPDLALPEDIKSNREKRRVKSKLLAQVYDYILLEKFQKRYYVTLPLITKHQNHSILDPQAGRFKVLHPKIIEKIYEIVNQGIYEKRVVKFMLQEYVTEFQNQLGLEIQQSDRSFYPTDRDISNHIRNARHLSKKNDLIVETNPVNPDDETIIGCCPDGNLTYATEVVSSFADIPTTCDVTYGITATDSATSLYQTTAVPESSFVETIVGSNDNNYSTDVEDTKTYLTTQDVNTVSIEDIVQNGMLEYYQNSNTTETPEMTASVTTTEEVDVNVLIEECKRNPHPLKKKATKKWPQKPKSLQKQLDLKTLLKTEIDNSFSIINQALVNEQDESKLKVVLKKVKVLQRVVQGKEPVTRRGKRTGIQAMVDIESLKENV